MSFLTLMYLADVAESASVVLTIIMLLTTAAYIIWWIIYAVSEGESGRPPMRLVVIAAAVALIATFIPSKQTIYAAAAMSAGKDAAQTEMGQKALKALNAWLDRQAKGEAK